MADISAELVKELRERTGAGFMDCKRALTEADGDLDKATALLRERGVAAAAKKAGRDAREGLVVELHPHGRPRRRAHRGQLRDRLRRPHRTSSRSSSATSRSRSPACAPLYVDAERIPAGRLAAKKAELARRRGDPEASPRTSASRSSTASSRSGTQQVVPATSSRSATRTATVRDLITETIATIGENIRVRRFTRYALGEEL